MALAPTSTSFSADDATSLVAHLIGAGDPLVCLPGGPMLDSDYLGDLGGLSAHRRLVLLDPRGTGASGIPDDPASYRCDRQVDDVDALRRHLGLESMDLLAHSAGANLAYRYAERFPHRLRSLVLVTPSLVGLGIEVPDAARSAVAGLRSGEPWYAAAAQALEDVQTGQATEETWAALTPLTFGRWDDAARAFDARMEERSRPDAASGFVADGAFDPPAARAALAALEVPVTVVAGQWDVGNPPPVMAEVAALSPHGRLLVQEGAGHYPWLDDPQAFRRTVRDALAAT